MKKLIMISMLAILITIVGCQNANIQPVSQDKFCPSDGTTDGQALYENTLASNLDYLDPVVYFMPQTQGQERITAGALATNGDWSTAVNMPCLESGTKWKAIAVTKQDSVHSAVGKIFTVEGSKAQTTLEGKAFDVLQFRVEDKYTGGRVYFDTASCGTTNTGYHAFTGTQCVVQDQSGQSGLTIDTDEYIEARIYLKTNNTKRQFGEDGLRTWMLVDADHDEFQEPEVYQQGTKDMIKNSLEDMDKEDRKKYNDYEYSFLINSIGDRETYIDFFMQSVADVNPSTDPIIEFCTEGRYNSNKKRDTILIGCWTDAASQAQVSTASRQYFKFDID